MDTLKPQKAFISNIVLFLAVFVAAFFLLEMGCRFFRLGEVPAEKVAYIGHTGYSPFLIFGPNIDRTFPQKNGEPVYFNSQGFRIQGNLPLEKAPGEYRVFALGGSTTEDIPNGNNKHYCGEANQLLAAERFDGKTFNCVNAAKSGYSSAHSLIRLQMDLLAFKPDMITVMDQVNDLTVNFFPADARSNYGNKYLHPAYAPPVFDLKRTLLRKSQALVLIYQFSIEVKRRFLGNEMPSAKKVSTFMRFNPEPTVLRQKEAFRNNLISIAQIGKAHGIRIVFLTQPAVFSEERYARTFTGEIHGVLYPKLDEFERLFSEYNEIIRDVAKEQSVSLIDMETLMGKDPRDFLDMIHYSASGIDHFAQFYSRELQKILQAEASAS